MKPIVESTARGWFDNQSREWRFQIFQSGKRMFLEVTLNPADYPAPQECFTIELCRDERKVQVDDAFLGHTDLFRQMADMVKNAQGMWQPKFQSGDIVLIDKAGSPTVKVIDPILQTSETFEKKQVLIDKDECSCSLRTLMQMGCARKRGQNSCEF
jgi:hypothetical protein